MDNASRNDQFEWTAGNDPALSHLQLIGVGGAGEVHEVCSLWQYIFR